MKRPEPDPHEACVEHVAQLYTLAMRLARDSTAAEDLVQETIANAIEHWDQYDPERNLRTWLYGILANTFINECRRRQRSTRVAVERPFDVRANCTDVPLTALERLTSDEMCDEILYVLDRLSPDHRAVVEQVDVKGTSCHDAAVALAIPYGTVLSRLFRARKVLRGALAELARDEWGIG